jgi:hypothetical protein
MRSLRLPFALIALTLWASTARADELPVSLQVQLLSKMSTYVSGFGPGETATVKVLIVHPAGDGPSRGAQAISTAITQLGKIGQHPAEVKLVPATGTKAFQAVIAAEKPQVIFFAPELDEKATTDVVEAASAGNVVTISGLAEHVRLGVVLGFSLVESRPRVLINLKQSKKQGIVFLSGLVSHSVVVDR